MARVRGQGHVRAIQRRSWSNAGSKFSLEREKNRCNSRRMTFRRATGELPAGLAGPRYYPERKALETAAFRVRALLPRGPDTPGAGERYTGESTRHEPYCIEKPDLLLSQTGRPAPSIRGRGIKQFSP